MARDGDAARIEGAAGLLLIGERGDCSRSSFPRFSSTCPSHDKSPCAEASLFFLSITDPQSLDFLRLARLMIRAPALKPRSFFCLLQVCNNLSFRYVLCSRKKTVQILRAKVTLRSLFFS